jgi:hypothetical protein
MMTTMCIKDHFGIHDRYWHGINVLLWLLFAQYLRCKDIPLRGRIFLFSGKRIGHEDMPISMGFFTDYNVITFMNLLMFFNINDLVYQSNYPLTVGNKREGVLDVPTMRAAINSSIQRGHVIEVVSERDELLPPPHKQFRIQDRHENQFFQWSLYMAHHSAVIELGDHSETEVLLEIEIICQSGKAAKTD